MMSRLSVHSSFRRQVEYATNGEAAAVGAEASATPCPRYSAAMKIDNAQLEDQLGQVLLQRLVS